MPAVYAHDSFGVAVRNRMMEDLKELTTKYDKAYRDGLQGPDIFFFYHPFYPNWVQKYGQNLHHSDASGFFRHAISVLREKGRDSEEYAYLLGFICHFTLDSQSHPYIAKQIEKSGVAHMEIEAEFDKYLMRLDGLDGVRFPVSNLIHADEETAQAISSFFPSVSEKKALASLKGMCFVKDFFNAPVPIRKHVYRPIMKFLRIYHQENGLMIQEEDNPLCEESNAHLSEILSESVPLAVSLQEQFATCLRAGKKLPARFHRDFE